MTDTTKIEKIRALVKTDPGNFFKLFFGTPAVAGRVPWNRVCPSFRLSGSLLGTVLLVFSKFWHGARNLYEVVRDRAGFSRKCFLLQKLGEWIKNLKVF